MRVVGAIATVTLRVRITSALSFCCASLADLQARARMCVWVASVHVKATVFPEATLAEHCVEDPEPDAVTVFAEPAAAQLGAGYTIAMPDR